MADFTIETGNTYDAICECCGELSRTVSGFVYRDGDATAVYFVQWTVGGVESHGAHFDVIVGEWGEESGPSDRSAVSLKFRYTDQEAGFMVIDASGRPINSDLASNALARESVVGTPLAQTIFDIVDAVWVQDNRIAEVTELAG